MINTAVNPYQPPRASDARDVIRGNQRKVSLRLAVLAMMMTTAYATVVSVYALAIAPSPPTAPGRLTIQLVGLMLVVAAGLLGWSFEWRSCTKLITGMSVVSLAVFGFASFVLFEMKLTRDQFFRYYGELLVSAVVLALLASLVARGAGSYHRLTRIDVDSSEDR